VSSEVDLFGGDERYLPQSADAQGDRLFAQWRSTVGCRPLMAGTKRERAVKRCIRKAIEAGYTHEQIFHALEGCWKFESDTAWSTALDIAHREAKPNLTDTQAAIIRLRGQREGSW
jgi:hypothetical protein